MPFIDRAAVAASVTLFVSTGSLAAGLDGLQVTVGAYCCTGPVPASLFTVPATATVGPGVEFPSGSLVVTSGGIIPSNVDIGTLTISISYTTAGTTAPANFNGYAFDFSGVGLPTITGATLNPSSTFSTAQIAIAFDSNSVFYSTAPGVGVSFDPSSRVLIDIALSPVPEPTTATLLLIGISIGTLLRARSKRPKSNRA